jgi:ornithine cyclodeaminase/alanine dehydrogenase-like protein (mu-crystallin family)
MYMKKLDEMYGAICLSENEVTEHLEEIGWRQIIDSVSDTFMEEAKKNVVSPPKGIIHLDHYENDYRIMPSYMLNHPEFIGTKLVSACPGNIGTKYPFAMASYILNDAKVQKPLMICGARAITAYRTAAATAVAVQALSRADSSVLGIIGCGVQADCHIPAIC